MAGLSPIYNTALAAIRLHSQQLARLQEMAATGSRIGRASDAPADAFRVLGLRADSYVYETYSKNLASVSDQLNVASGALQQVSEIVARVRELTAQGVSGTYSAANRVPVALEIDALLQQVLSLANTRHQGQYLFAGNDASTAPFVAEYTDGRITGVSYVGSTHAADVPMGPGVRYPGALVGDQVFRRTDRQAPEFLGNSGAAAGTGTASVRGDAWLTLTHDATAYLGASGVAPGTSSALGDTVLGTGHTLTIDALANVLRLDGGPDVTFTGAETDLRVVNADGDVVYVDVTALAPAFQGDVSLQASGYLSLDDGASRVAIDYSDANLAVTDSRTGRILYVDCTAVARTGAEPVRVPGTYDLFGTLVTVRDLLLNVRGLPEDTQTQLLTEAIGALAEVSQQLSWAQTSVGGQIGAMAVLETSLEDLKAFSDGEAARLENADIVQVATQLAYRQILYEMTLATTARLLGVSLFDYI